MLPFFLSFLHYLSAYILAFCSTQLSFIFFLSIPSFSLHLASNPLKPSSVNSPPPLPQHLQQRAHPLLLPSLYVVFLYCFLLSFSPQPHSITSPFLLQIFLIAPGLDFTKKNVILCLFSCHPLPFHSLRRDFYVFPPQIFFPLIRSFCPPPSPVVSRSFLHHAFNNVSEFNLFPLVFPQVCLVFNCTPTPLPLFPHHYLYSSAQPVTVLLFPCCSTPVSIIHN